MVCLVTKCHVVRNITEIELNSKTYHYTNSINDFNFRILSNNCKTYSTMIEKSSF